MRAKVIPQVPPKGTRAEVAAAYGLTVEEYRRHHHDFIMSEGWHDDGHESETLHDWLTYDPTYRDPTPWQKGDDLAE